MFLTNRAQSFSTVPAHVKKVSCAEQTRGKRSSRFPLADRACSMWMDTPAYQPLLSVQMIVVSLSSFQIHVSLKIFSSLLLLALEALF